MVATADARNKYVLLISNSGSFSATGTSQAVAAASQLKSRGVYADLCLTHSYPPQCIYLFSLEENGHPGFLYVFFGTVGTNTVCITVVPYE